MRSRRYTICQELFVKTSKRCGQITFSDSPGQIPILPQASPSTTGSRDIRIGTNQNEARAIAIGAPPFSRALTRFNYQQCSVEVFLSGGDHLLHLIPRHRVHPGQMATKCCNCPRHSRAKRAHGHAGVQLAVVSQGHAGTVAVTAGFTEKCPCRGEAASIV